MKQILHYCFFPLLIATGCINNNEAVQGPALHKTDTVTGRKPSSSFTDTVVINKPCAVFYEPDSLQLQKIKNVTDEGLYKASMHEYEYQVTNAKKFLNQNFQQLQIHYIKKARYILFQNGKVDYLVNLDNYDPVGMFVFDASKKPVLIDMTNVETQVSDYFTGR